MQQMALSLRSGTPLSIRGGRAGTREPATTTSWCRCGRRTASRSSIRVRARSCRSAPCSAFPTSRPTAPTTACSRSRPTPRPCRSRRTWRCAATWPATWRCAPSAPIAVIVPILMLVMWWVVSGSLEPVARVRSQVARRARPTTCRRSIRTDLPDEVRPLVQELNLLFGACARRSTPSSNFVADAAHELRTPLAALRCRSQSLERAGDDGGARGGGDAPDRRHRPRHAPGRAAAGAGAPGSLGRERRPHRPVDLAEVAPHVGAGLARPRTTGASTSACCRMPTRATVRRAARRAAHPAAQPGRQRGEVHARQAARSTSSVADGPPARLSVEDSGPGIAPERARARLVRFYRVGTGGEVRRQRTRPGDRQGDRRAPRRPPGPRPVRPPRRPEGGACLSGPPATCVASRTCRRRSDSRASRRSGRRGARNGQPPTGCR